MQPAHHPRAGSLETCQTYQHLRIGVSSTTVLPDKWQVAQTLFRLSSSLNMHQADTWLIPAELTAALSA
jgi:hypothetical protein